MSASLVGSEMCIRDRPCLPSTRTGSGPPGVSRGSPPGPRGRRLQRRVAGDSVRDVPELGP
eukprot:5364514-Alexandrium_andersonii.AAC.1